MENNILLNLTKEEFRLIEGCLLTTKETFKTVPVKNDDVKNRIIEIDNFIKKYDIKRWLFI